MKIDIKHVAKLARLRLEDDQVEKFEQQMLSILEMVANLPEITGSDDGLDPSNPMILRKDVVTPSMDREDLLRIAPASQSGCILVPKIVE